MIQNLFSVANVNTQNNMRKWSAWFVLLYNNQCFCFNLHRFAKFVLHAASRVTFLGLLIFSTLKLSVKLEDATQDEEATEDDIIASYLSYRSADIHDLSRICIFLWIVGKLLSWSDSAALMCVSFKWW